MKTIMLVFGTRPEGIKAGTLKLVGTDEEAIYANFKLLLENQNAYNAMSQATHMEMSWFVCVSQYFMPIRIVIGEIC